MENFLSTVDKAIDRTQMLGLDPTVLRITLNDSVVFKKELEELSGLKIARLKTYKGLMVSSSVKPKSFVVAMDRLRKYSSRYFELESGEELIKDAV